MTHASWRKGLRQAGISSLIRLNCLHQQHWVAGAGLPPSSLGPCCGHDCSSRGVMLTATLLTLSPSCAPILFLLHGGNSLCIAKQHWFPPQPTLRRQEPELYLSPKPLCNMASMQSVACLRIPHDDVSADITAVYHTYRAAYVGLLLSVKQVDRTDGLFPDTLWAGAFLLKAELCTFSCKFPHFLLKLGMKEMDTFRIPDMTQN